MRIFDERNRLSFYHPFIVQTLPPECYPKTAFVRVPEGEHLAAVVDQFDRGYTGPIPDWLSRFAVELITTSHKVSPGTFFLRNDIMSGKHVHGTPCIVRLGDDVLKAVMAIVEQTEMLTFFTYGCDVWAVREFFPTESQVKAFSFSQPRPSGLPIVEEIRYIVRSGQVEQYFLYWPKRALYHNAYDPTGRVLTNDEVDRLVERLSATMDTDDAFLRPMTLAVANAIGGDWSIDWMRTAGGWKLIDMAIADDSWTPAHDEKEAAHEAELEKIDWSQYFVPKAAEESTDGEANG